MHLGGVVKALRAPEARGRLAHFAWFERMGVSTHTPAKAWGRRAVERRDAYKLSGGDRKLLHELDGCAVETRAVRGRSLPETPFGVRPAEKGGLTVRRPLHMPREAVRSSRVYSGCEDAGLG